MPAPRARCSGFRCPPCRTRGPAQRPERPRAAQIDLNKCRNLGRAGLGLRRRSRLLLRRMPAIDAVAQLLAGAEEDPALGLDRDHLSGLGVTPVVPLVVLDVERAKAADFNVVALAESRFHRLEDRLDGELRLLLRELALGH